MRPEIISDLDNIVAWMWQDLTLTVDDSETETSDLAYTSTVLSDMCNVFGKEEVMASIGRYYDKLEVDIEDE